MLLSNYNLADKLSAVRQTHEQQDAVEKLLIMSSNFAVFTSKWWWKCINPPVNYTATT